MKNRSKAQKRRIIGIAGIVALGALFLFFGRGDHTVQAPSDDPARDETSSRAARGEAPRDQTEREQTERDEVDLPALGGPARPVTAIDEFGVPTVAPNPGFERPSEVLRGIDAAQPPIEPTQNGPGGE